LQGFHESAVLAFLEKSSSNHLTTVRAELVAKVTAVLHSLLFGGDTANLTNHPY
jgi:hypothetical protein